MDQIQHTLTLGNSIAVPCAERVFAGIMAVEEERKPDGEENMD